jgi:ATP-dependent Clp protease ATP-binding subunit ClpA
MNIATLKNDLINKLNNLSAEQLQTVANLVEQLEQDTDPETMTVREAKAMEKWEFLLKHDRERDESDPLSNQEIQMICEVLRRQNKNLPSGLAKSKLNIPDNFNEPLPDEILDLFYQ